MEARLTMLRRQGSSFHSSPRIMSWGRMQGGDDQCVNGVDKGGWEEEGAHISPQPITDAAVRGELVLGVLLHNP